MYLEVFTFFLPAKKCEPSRASKNSLASASLRLLRFFACKKCELSRARKNFKSKLQLATGACRENFYERIV